jgi:site-specific DNA-cytosine methylase
MCYHHNGHSDQCNLANGIDPEPEPEPDPDPPPEPDYDTDVEPDYAQEDASAAPLVVGHSPFSGLLDPSVHYARGGKSKERRLAELMTGPVVVPEPIESADSAKHRSLNFDEIMKLTTTLEETRIAEALCQAAGYVYVEADVMVSGSDAESEFLAHVVSVVALGDELTLHCGSYRRALAVYRKQWWQTHERYAVPGRIENIRGLCLDQLVDYIKLTASRGVDVRTGADPPSEMLGVRNHQSVDEHGTEMVLKVWDDFKRCGAFLVSDKCSPLLGDVQIAPMSRVDKHDDEGFVDNSEGGRPIYDGKHGKKSLNKKTPPSTHPPSASPTHLALIFYIVWLCLLLPGVPLLCCKRDVKAAFKLIWMSIADSNWMGARFPSSLFVAAKRKGANVAWSSMFVLFIVLQFGWSESPSEYGVYGWAISMTHRSLGPALICQLPTLAYMNLVFVDDAAIVEPDLFGRAEASCVAYNWSLFQVLGLSLNLKKLLVDGMLGVCHIFWGITYHLEKASLGVQFIWVELTRSKKIKASAFMRLKHAQPGERAVLLVDHQRLAGNVQWWSVCAPAFRGLLGSLYHMSRSDSSTWVSPVGTAEEKELAWQEYDDVKTLLAMLVEMGGEEPSYFQARIIDQLDFYDLAHIPRGLGVQVRYIGSDSNGHETGGIMSGIDYSEGTWTFARASEYAPTLLARLGVPTSEVTKDLIIFVTELLVVISLAAEHGAKWSGFIVASLIDNDNSKEAITSRRSSNRYVRYLLLVLIALEFKFKFRLVAYFVGTKANWLLDGIGRFERFQDRSDDEVQAMIQAELIDVHVPGLTFEPLTKLLDFFTSGDSVLSSFALPDGSVDHIASKYSISESMGSEPDEWPQSTMTESEALEVGRVGFGGVCSGIEALELAHRKKGVPTSFFMELDQMKFNFLDSVHPKFIHKCMDVLGEEYRSWFFPSPLALPRIVGGGPPCVFAASSGRRKGMSDHRSRPFTHGLAKVIKSLDDNRPSTVWSVIVENVAGVAWVGDGEALIVMLKGLYELGLTLTPRPSGGVKNIQVVCARALGGRAVRPRLMGYLEKRWMIRWLGHASPIEYPKALPSALSEILEPDEDVAVWLIVPGRFTPLPGTKLDDRGIKLAGYIDYGGPDDPVVRGSLVRLDDSESIPWRVMRGRGFQYDLMKADRDDPVYRKGVEPSSISFHLRERRRVNHPDGGAGIITKFGEPGLVGGPGHQLVLRSIGVSWLTARELWRLQGGSVAEQDARFDAFIKVNPSASYEDLAGAAGDSIATVWADAAAKRSVRRCALVVEFARKFVSSWVAARWRSKQRP